MLDGLGPEGTAVSRPLLHPPNLKAMSPYTAACICNSCQLTLPGPPLLTLFCHCTECRRTAGADYATLCPYRAPAVTIEKDNFASYTIKNIERFWCKTCGSNVFFKNHKLGLEVVCAFPRLVDRFCTFFNRFEFNRTDAIG